jgi:hypothetical protein
MYAEKTAKETRKGSDRNGKSTATTSSHTPAANGSKGYSDNLFKNHLDKIIKLQAIWRGYHARKYISMLRSKQIGSSKYFTYEESRETVTQNKFNQNAKREKRAPY